MSNIKLHTPRCFNAFISCIITAAAVVVVVAVVGGGIVVVVVVDVVIIFIWSWSRFVSMLT